MLSKRYKSTEVDRRTWLHNSPFTMQHGGRGVEVVGLLLCLASETHWFAVSIGSILRLHNNFYFIFVP